MTFNQQINCIQTLISKYDLVLTERKDRGFVNQTMHDVRGVIEGRQIYICVRYGTNTIYWRDRVSGEEKTFTF